MTDSSQTASARIYLASTSPRRRELLHQIGVSHELLIAPAPAGEDEPQHPGEAAADYVQRTALDKALRGHDWMRREELPPLPLLAADTSVILQGQVLGKPADQADAQRILTALSGRTHEVHTAVVLMTQHGLRLQALSISQVSFHTLSDQDIVRYCSSGEPYGKAGAYGIQGLAGAFISRLNGSYTGVMGLPLFETAQLLKQAGLTVP
ncbi:hypothetical protein HA402_010041 [Bradysia odoriphaga]|nr:hypothetical protein HA402_010041 [Bradysia odoriphaga]